jgi:hypothetical protein
MTHVTSTGDTIQVLYPATARMLDTARTTGTLDPAASMHPRPWVATYIALMYADREARGSPRSTAAFTSPLTMSTRGR